MLFLLIFKSVVTCEVKVLWWKSVFHVYGSILVFCLFPMVYVRLVSWYAFVEKKNMSEVLYWNKEVYVSWVMKYVFWVMIWQSNEWIRKDYVCVLLDKGMGKRIMRSNRRETWVSFNLPPWLSTSWTISLYCSSLSSLQTCFICDGNFG